VLGESGRAKEWMHRALMIDPDNMTMRYNLACWTIEYLDDATGALDLLEPYFQNASAVDLKYAKIDPDLDKLKEEPRFQSMTKAADARLAERKQDAAA
jgi:adenylate cyclase